MIEEATVTLTVGQLIAAVGVIGGGVLTLLRILVQGKIREFDQRLTSVEHAVSIEVGKLTDITDKLKQDYHTVDKEVAVLIASKERKL